MTYTDKVLVRYGYHAAGGSGSGKIELLDESIRKQRADMKRLQKLELAKNLNIKDADELHDRSGFWETPVMMAKRSMAAAQAKDIMEVADREGRKVTDYEILQVLRLWDFRENETRLNVMREGQKFVYSDTVGLVASRTGLILAKEETRRYPEFGRLLNRWLREHVDAKDLGAEFVYTSININKNYAGRLHRDGNNVGPSMLKAFGDFTGGQLNYFAEDDRSAKLEVLGAMKNTSVKLDVQKGVVLFDGKRGHAVDDFRGERYSLVFFTCPRFEKMSKECRGYMSASGFPIPTQGSMAKVLNLLRKPRGYRAGGRREEKDKSITGAPFVFYAHGQYAKEEKRAQAYWKKRGMRKVISADTSLKVQWEHNKHHQGRKWSETSFFVIPREPARKDLVLRSASTMADAAIFLNKEEAKAPKAVAKEGCCALFGCRTKVWYVLYARGQRQHALEVFGMV